MPVKPPPGTPVYAVCPICGRRLVAYLTGQRGRPRTYCGEDCASVAQATELLNRAVPRLAADLDNDQWIRVRGQVQSIVNVRAVNRGVPKKPRGTTKKK